MVRTQRGTGFRDLDNRIGEFRRLDLSRAPGKFDGRVDIVLCEITLRHADRFRGNPFALKVFHGVDSGVFRHGENPAERIAPDFAVNELRGFDHIGAVFLNPVETGQSAVKNSFLDITGHFLSADQHTFDIRIVDGRIIGT